ncbi:MAG: hypothetical protein RR954_08875, partial [Christensenellaceae bacterium]
MGKHELSTIAEIISMGADVAPKDFGKKKFQKLIYLVEKVGGVSLGYEYSIYFYGPYSSALNDDLGLLVSRGLVHYEIQAYSHLIRADKDKIAQNRTSTNEAAVGLTQEDCERINGILARFGKKSPSALELLTTAHYVAGLLGECKSSESIQAGVKKIKGSKYTSQEI